MNEVVVTYTELQKKIFTIRSIQVMLDSDLAELYNVETKVFNQTVKRNIIRFPEKYRFQITDEEFEHLKSQIMTSDGNSLRSQIVTLKNNRGKHRKYLPYVFTEQGVSMLSAVLKSEIAIEISMKIMDSFVAMRKFISQNAGIFQRLESLEQKLLNYDDKFTKLFNALESKYIQPTQDIFYNGEIFNAYFFINKLIKSAKHSIILIDNYIDETTLLIFSKIPEIKITIYTKNISRTLELDIAKYNEQYNNLELKKFELAHDRFLIIDNEIYHIGASLKDLGKKWFAFSKMDHHSLEILDKLKFFERLS
jgi:hypothetical protein